MPRPDQVRQRFRKRRDRFIDSLNTGRFLGGFRLQWVGPDLFECTPDPEDLFRFERHDADGNVLEVNIPERMATDGVSIPRIAQSLPGFSPWEYGPAYLIHDWEFEAHDRAREGGPPFDKSFEAVNLAIGRATWDE